MVHNVLIYSVCNETPDTVVKACPGLPVDVSDISRAGIANLFATLLSQQSCSKLPSAYSPAGAVRAAAYIARPCPALPCCVWARRASGGASDRATPALCPRCTGRGDVQRHGHTSGYPLHGHAVEQRCHRHHAQPPDGVAYPAPIDSLADAGHRHSQTVSACLTVCGSVPKYKGSTGGKPVP